MKDMHLEYTTFYQNCINFLLDSNTNVESEVFKAFPAIVNILFK